MASPLPKSVQDKLLKSKRDTTTPQSPLQHIKYLGDEQASLLESACGVTTIAQLSCLSDDTASRHGELDASTDSLVAAMAAVTIEPSASAPPPVPASPVHPYALGAGTAHASGSGSGSGSTGSVHHTKGTSSSDSSGGSGSGGGTHSPSKARAFALHMLQTRPPASNTVHYETEGAGLKLELDMGRSRIGLLMGGGSHSYVPLACVGGVRYRSGGNVDIRVRVSTGPVPVQGGAALSPPQPDLCGHVVTAQFAKPDSAKQVVATLEPVVGPLMAAQPTLSVTRSARPGATDGATGAGAAAGLSVAAPSGGAASAAAAAAGLSTSFVGAKGGHRYHLTDAVLGVGAFAEVRRGVRIDTGETFAVKVFKPMLGGDAAADRRKIVDEIKLQRTLDHPKIVTVADHGETADGRLCLVLREMSGGELFDYVLEHDGPLSEGDTRKVMRQVLAALQYLHARSFIHRDIKLDNVILASKDTGLDDVALCDFGEARRTDRRGRAMTIKGSPEYLAPEIQRKQVLGESHASDWYTTAIDMYSAGVCMYVCLVKDMPFRAELLRQRARDRAARRGANAEHRQFAAQAARMADMALALHCMERNDFVKENESYAALSDGAKDLIERLMVADPEARLTAEQALRHPWVLGADGPAAGAGE